MGVTSVQGFKFKLVANGEILDLFQDEEIKLSDNVTGLFDLGILPADFTRQITLPGSKKNNHFFEFVYDISVENPYTFSTNQKVQCYLDFDGIYLSDGYLQLNKVNVYQNKFIDSYEVTIYGGLASFGRSLKRTFLTDLTGSLSQYNHTASFENISASWGGNLFNGTIVYPLAEYGQQIQYQTNNTQFGISSTDGALCVADWKPAIKLKTVWDACFETFGYTYTSSFWNESWTDNIYMLCNNKLQYPVFDNVDLETYGKFRISPTSGSGTSITMSPITDTFLNWYNIESNPGGNLDSQLAYTLGFNTKIRGELNLNFSISGSGTSDAVPLFDLVLYDTTTTATYVTPLTNYNNYMYQIQAYNNGPTRPQVFELLTEFNTAQIIPAGTYEFFLRYTPSGTGTVTVVLNPNNNTKSYLSVKKINQGADGRVMEIPQNLPFGTAGIKLIDFITAVQKKFNLVIYPNKTKLNEFIVEPFNRWYKLGQIKSFDRYINLDSKIEVTPANNLAVQNLNFGDTLDGDYISQQFAKGAGREFGKAYYIDTDNFFSQGTYEVKTTFASSPLVYVSGTGVSGSSLPPSPTQYYAGTPSFTYSSDYTQACISTISFNVYTTDGLFTTGEIMYRDEYGTNPVVGLRYFKNPTTDEVTNINQFTGQIGLGQGYYCP